MNRNAFVVMPFSATTTCAEAQWTEIYENVFHPAFVGAGYSCERAKPMTGTLASSIIEQLRTARIVLADLTDRNSNVFYELGIRHCLKKGTILAAQGAHHIPSDLTGYWFIDYGTSPGAVTRFKSEIKRLISVIEEDSEKSDNPVADYLDREKLSIYGHIQRDAVKKLGALATELTGIRNILAEAPSDPEYVTLLSCDCLKLLCQTMYIDVGPALLKIAYELVYKLKQLQKQPTNGRLIEENRIAAEHFFTEINKIRELMVRGEYAEPPAVTTMVWVPVPQPARQHGIAMLDELSFPMVSMPGRWNRSCVSLSLSETPHLWTPSRNSDEMPEQARRGHAPARTVPPVFQGGRPARRMPCPCGSGKLFKNCCGRG